jgi:hypothetical protein
LTVFNAAVDMLVTLCFRHHISPSRTIAVFGSIMREKPATNTRRGFEHGFEKVAQTNWTTTYQHILA